MPQLSFLDRLREFLTSQRFMWIITILFGVLVILYFLFATIFFNPLEDDLGDMADVVPREVDYFLHWKKPGERFGDFPVPTVWEDFSESKVGQKLEAGGTFKQWDASTGSSQMAEELRKVMGNLPPGLSLTNDILKEVVLAGRGTPSLGSEFDGLLMLRVSFKVKAGISLLGFSSVRSKVQALGLEELGGDRYKLVQFPPFGMRDAFLTRMKDVLVLSTSREWLDIAKDLENRSGQDSIGRASKYRDNVTAFLTPSDEPLEIFVDWDEASKKFGVFPNPKSTAYWARVLSSFFNTELLRYLSGYWLPGNHFEGRFSGDIDLSEAPAFQRGWAEGKGIGEKSLKEFAGRVPAESFLFGAIAGDSGRTLLQLESSFPKDVRRILDEIIIETGKYQGMAHLFETIGQTLHGGLYFSIRRNDYPADETLDVEHDDSPVPVFAMMGKLKDPSGFENLLEFFKNNASSFAQGSDRPRVESVPIGGGSKAISFSSPMIPGTGEFVVYKLPNTRPPTVVVTNSYKYLRDIVDVAHISESANSADEFKLSHQKGFKSILNGIQGGSKFFLYGEPLKSAHWLSQLAEQSARAEFLTRMENSVFRQWRPEEEKKQREFLFPGAIQLKEAQKQRLMDAVDEALQDRASAQWERQRPTMVERAQLSFLPAMALKWLGISLEMGRRDASLLISGELSFDTEPDPFYR
ncbi:MAG: hypothetical protein QGH51_04140 [Planctomycetota bacterium]|nr:hypothetical protein [Planctomycetota bacterium]